MTSEHQDASPERCGTDGDEVACSGWGDSIACLLVLVLVAGNDVVRRKGHARGDLTGFEHPELALVDIPGVVQGEQVLGKGLFVVAVCQLAQCNVRLVPGQGSQFGLLRAKEKPLRGLVFIDCA